jgi:hypothetical protein
MLDKFLFFLCIRCFRHDQLRNLGLCEQIALLFLGAFIRFREPHAYSQ